jgi:signal transduction histidine kinase
VTEFLELTRPRPPQRERVDLSDVVRQVLELEAQVVEEQEVELHAQLAPRAVVIGDVEKLKHVVLNLVVNALDAMESGGSLRASVEVRGAHVCLALSDTGGGIEESNLADVFDPFFTTKPAGTGLGLAIVRKLVELHGGRVELTSSPGKGTEVVLTFPRAPDPEA